MSNAPIVNLAAALELHHQLELLAMKTQPVQRVAIFIKPQASTWWPWVAVAMCFAGIGVGFVGGYLARRELIAGVFV